MRYGRDKAPAPHSGLLEASASPVRPQSLLPPLRPEIAKNYEGTSPVPLRLMFYPMTARNGARPESEAPRTWR